MNKEEIMNLVSKICGTEKSDCRSINKKDLARELLNLANVPDSASIEEIPLDWGNQVVVLFLLPGDKNYYSLFTGIGNDGKFYFELTITGVLESNGYFDFFQQEKVLGHDYFKNYTGMTKTAYIYTLKETIQKKIKSDIIAHFTGEEFPPEELMAEVDAAMSGRLCDIENLINVGKYL